MSSETSKAFIQQSLDTLRKDKSSASLEAFMTDEDLKQHIAMYDAVLPGYWIEAKDILADGDRVNLRGTVHGVHNGLLGDIPPTGKEVEFDLFITYRIADGKIAEHWMLVDMLVLLQQIGAMPTPSQG